MAVLIGQIISPEQHNFIPANQQQGCSCLEMAIISARKQYRPFLS